MLSWEQAQMSAKALSGQHCAGYLQTGESALPRLNPRICPTIQASHQRVWRWGGPQIVQAEAAGIAPHVDMNPILLKPTGEKKSQVVLNGLVHGDHTAMDYHKNKAFYFKKACQAFDRLAKQYDRIILEGAGSCAEVNLMDGDIVNFAMAEYADADVILVADIHRGGGVRPDRGNP